MAKRFTDTEIWDEDWFLELRPGEKLFWGYLRDRCDHAGIWRPNFKRFEMSTDVRIKPNDFLERINADRKRIHVLPNGRWLIIGFLAFQYGKHLNPNNRVHASVIRQLENNQAIDFIGICILDPSLTSTKGQGRVKEGVKEKEKEKEKEEGGVGGDDAFDTFWKAYPKKVGKGAAQKAWKKIKSPSKTVTVILDALQWQTKCNDWTKENGQFIPHPATYLNQRRWEDEPQETKKVSNFERDQYAEKIDYSQSVLSFRGK